VCVFNILHTCLCLRVLWVVYFVLTTVRNAQLSLYHLFESKCYDMCISWAYVTRIVVVVVVVVVVTCIFITRADSFCAYFLSAGCCLACLLTVL
jgi:hypothetical protein